MPEFSLAALRLFLPGVINKSLRLNRTALPHRLLKASLAAKHKKSPPVARSIAMMTRYFFRRPEASCVDRISVTDHRVPIST